MDEMLQRTQLWLNRTYGGRTGYVKVPEDGGAATNSRTLTYTGLIRALQLELGGVTVDGDFGNGTVTRFNSVYPSGIAAIDETTGAQPANLAYIIQGGLWNKGYNPVGFTGIFGPKTGDAVKKFQGDAGIAQSGIVSGYLLQALMNTDGYTLDTIHGFSSRREVQRKLNELYWNRIGLTATNGIWDRKSHKNLIKACQIEWSITADGVFGNDAYNAAPTLSKTTSGYTASKRLLQCALSINGFYSGAFDGSFGTGTYTSVLNFQEWVCISADGIAGKGTWASLLKSCGYTGRTTTACDTAVQLTAQQALNLKAAGYNTVGRYLTNAGEGTGYLNKKLTTSEVANLTSAGLKVFPIYQTIGNKISYFTYSQGAKDATAALKAAEAIGFPDGTVIYFAVDFDVRTTELSTIVRYFDGIGSRVGGYKVGVYGPRMVCQELVNTNRASNCFVADMSSGFEGNIGYMMPDGWAYDQIAETTVSGIGIDKLVASPRATAVEASALVPRPERPGEPGNYPGNMPEIIGYDNREKNPQILINRGSEPINVYESKVPGNGGSGLSWLNYYVGGNVIGQIETNAFYTRFRTGELDLYGSGQWLNDGDAVHLVLFRDSAGYIRYGYIQEELGVGEFNVVESSLPNQASFMDYKYDPNTNDLVMQGNVSEFKLQYPADYYDIDGVYLGVLPEGTIISPYDKGAVAGLDSPWCGLFWSYDVDGDGRGVTFGPPDKQNGQGWVELGYKHGTKGGSRGLY